MIRRVLRVGDWMVEFLFCVGRYDIDGVLACLYDAGAPRWVMKQALDLMENCDYDCGFTYSARRPQRYSYYNRDKQRSVVLIGPTSSGAEFLDTTVHELRHLTDAIAKSMGVELDSEEAAYISGDTARELADIIFKIGTSRS